jgi:uncharacterized protein YcfJ
MELTTNKIINCILSVAGVVAVMASPVFADSYNTTGIVIKSKAQYSNVSQSIPTQNCYDVQVQVQRQGSTGDTLAGAIFGGVVGNQFGNGSGKDAMTVLGAILGADAANRNNQGGGYRTERQCETVYRTENSSQLTGYSVTYEVFGIRETAITNRNYGIGDPIPVIITVRLQ